MNIDWFVRTTGAIAGERAGFSLRPQPETRRFALRQPSFDDLKETLSLHIMMIKSSTKLEIFLFALTLAGFGR